MTLQIGKQIRLTSVFVFLLFTSLLTTSCKREKYDSIRDAKDWQNPFLIIEGDGVEVLLPDDRAKVTPFGMNVQGIENRQLALNIMHWLSKIL